jgi:threonine dehydrogenase-like Zn-dependent dehydrogenase
MKQSVLVRSRQSRLDDVERPAVAAGDVLVAVHASGICASELHTWLDGPTQPLALGHEVAGEVLEVGEGVRGFAPGDRVTGLFHEGFAEYAAANAAKVAAIPSGMSYEAALGEPLACAVSAARRTHVELGDRVAIVGLGFMGLLMAQLLRLKGPSEIVGIDLRPDARQNGLALACDQVFARDEIEGAGLPPFDVVVEATGTQDGLTLAGLLAREHGVLSILGYHQGGPRSVDMRLWNYKALEVLNAHERRPDYRMDCMRRGLALAAAGRIDLARLPTHRFGLGEVDAAFTALLDKPAGFIKAIIVADPNT